MESDILYTLAGKEIGKINEENLNNLLDEATLQTYTYLVENGQYSLYRLEMGV